LTGYNPLPATERLLPTEQSSALLSYDCRSMPKDAWWPRLM